MTRRPDNNLAKATVIAILLHLLLAWGMNVWGPSAPSRPEAKSIIVIKRSMGRGYAGIDNTLYTDPKTGMLFADAKAGLEDLLAAVKEL